MNQLLQQQPLQVPLAPLAPAPPEPQQPSSVYLNMVQHIIAGNTFNDHATIIPCQNNISRILLETY
ncbi:2781_t:CDS:1, partial [Ambispora leptoticha]